MIKTGMVSVTFRQFDVDEVIRRTKEAGLMAIEWGGDVHVPHGDLDKARYTADKMRENGLEIASYGSYYRALEDETGHSESVGSAQHSNLGRGEGTAGL